MSGSVGWGQGRKPYFFAGGRVLQSATFTTVFWHAILQYSLQKGGLRSRIGNGRPSPARDGGE